MALEVRPYRPEDREVCLALFDSNIPHFFAPAERADFTAFLEAGPEDYFVAADGGEIVGCGGVFVRNGEGGLCWGMVDRTRHRTGVGSALLHERLAHLSESHPQLEAVLLDTSQHSRGFFTQFGFEVLKLTPDGYAPGLDRVDMRLPLEKLKRLPPYG